MQDKSQKSKITIRKFTIEDYEAIIKLWKEAKLLSKPKGRDSRKNIKIQLEQSNTIYLVAEISGKIIGSVFGTHDGRKGWINRLAVLPAHQKIGIARRLVNELEKYFHKLGIDIIASLVENWNKTSLKAFQKLGYIKHKDIAYFTKRKAPQV